MRESTTTTDLIRQEYATLARYRSCLYGFLATFYKREPNEDLIRHFRKSEILQSLEGLGMAFDLDQICTSPVKEVTQKLATEYTRLFIGPGKHISLNESVHREGEGMLWGKTTVAVKGFIQIVGLDLDAQWSGLPDHLSVELELMQRLTQREAEAWSENDFDSIRGSIKLQREFMERHLLQWIPRLCDAILSQNPSTLYVEITALMQEYIQNESKYIDKLVI